MGKPHRIEPLAPLSVAGKVFLPVPMAAKQLQICLPTLYKWIKGQARTKITVQAIQTIEDRHFYVDEDDVKILRNRFVSANSGEKIRDVALFRYCKDEARANLFLSTFEAAKFVNVSRGLLQTWVHTLRTHQGVTLDVAIDTVTRERFTSKNSLLKARAAFWPKLYGKDRHL